MNRMRSKATADREAATRCKLQFAMSSSAYAHKGAPRTLLSVVALLDVLGFQQEIRDASAKGEADALLQRFSTAIRKWYDSLRRDADTGEGSPRLWDVKTFTDNVVIGHPIRQDGEPELGQVLLDVALLQLGLAREGFFVRGGVAVGPLYMDEDIAFGAGPLDADDAEQAAETPRVVLHRSAIAYVDRHLRYYGKVALSPQNEYLFFDEDGKMALDYLSSLWPEPSEEPFFNWLAKHRDVVAQKLTNYRARPRIRAKYAWVARYHNYFCNTLPGGAEY